MDDIDEIRRACDTIENVWRERLNNAVAAERKRCANICDGLVISTKITYAPWSEAERNAVILAAEWLRDEIRKGG
jgi:hypothetical protein